MTYFFIRRRMTPSFVVNVRRIVSSLGIFLKLLLQTKIGADKCIKLSTFCAIANLHQICIGIGVQSQKAVQKHNLKIRVEFASLQCTWQKPLRAKNSNHTAYKIRRTMQTMRRWWWKSHKKCIINKCLLQVPTIDAWLLFSNKTPTQQKLGLEEKEIDHFVDLGWPQSNLKSSFQHRQSVREAKKGVDF